MLEAILWDVDGTLAETERDGHLVAFNAAFLELDIPWRWNEQRYGDLLRVAGGFERLLFDMESQPLAPITLEERSRSTIENAAYTREIMDANGWDTALVVSDGYHLLRATWILSQEDMTFTTSPASTPPRLFNHLTAIAREVVALHWQLLKTVLGLPYTFVPWL